jgi:hypothetical protein
VSKQHILQNHWNLSFGGQGCLVHNPSHREIETTLSLFVIMRCVKGKQQKATNIIITLEIRFGEEEKEGWGNSLTDRQDRADVLWTRFSREERIRSP